MAKRDRGECQVEGCSSPAKERGICAKHTKGGYVVGCTVEGCNHELWAKGRCQAHYMRQYRKKNDEPVHARGSEVRNYVRGRNVTVFTRVDKETAKVIAKASGRSTGGMYEKAAEILTNWASRNAG